jgi:hypothetical protein
MNTERRFYVYKHVCIPCTTSNGIYIGITGKKNPNDRWHASGSGYTKGQKKMYETIQLFGPENWMNPEVWSHEILFSNLTKIEAYTKEKELIAYYDSYHNGLNSSLGGELNVKYATAEEAELAYRAVKKKKTHKRMNDPEKHALDLERSKIFIANKRSTDSEYKKFDNQRNLALYEQAKQLKEKLMSLDKAFPGILTSDEKELVHGALYKCRSKKYLNELLLKFNTI